MLPSAILSILASANLFLTPQDPEPWEHLVPDLDTRIADTLRTTALRRIAVTKDDGGTVVGSDTTDHWIDGRGRCRTSRTWSHGATPSLRVLQEWGIRAGLPSDSSSLEDKGPEVRSEFQSTPQDANRRIVRRTTGTASGLFADTLILARDAQGRLLSRRQDRGGWIDSLWADFDNSGSISRWRIRTENGWGIPSTTHFPQWAGNLLKRDSSIDISAGADDRSILTIQDLACTWNDTLLVGCTTPSVPLDTLISRWTSPIDLRTRYTLKSDDPNYPIVHLVDTITVLRDASGHPLELRSTTGSARRKTWDSQGRLLSMRRIKAASIQVDSLEYEGASPLPSLRRTGTAYNLTAIPSTWDTVTTYTYTTAALTGLTAHRSASLSSRLEGRTLRIDGLTGHATLRLSDLSGRRLAQTETDGREARLELPAGSRLLVWDVLDARGTVIGQGRLAGLR